MTSHERIRRMFNHQEADRIPITDGPWDSTLDRWQREGMTPGMSYLDFFGMDKLLQIRLTDNSPRFPVQLLSESDTDATIVSEWGVTMRQWKHVASTPEFLSHTIVNMDSWRLVKQRISPTKDRISWDLLQQNYKRWRQEGTWITAVAWFGFDVTHSWMVGTERVLLALVEDPEWMIDMWRTELETELALLDMVWDAGYTFDALIWYDDMSYKFNQFFSLAMYRNLLKPFHQRAIDWAHAKGIKAHLHSCGDVRPFVPELVAMGLDALNPMEVKAGVDPLALKQQFGKDLVLHGGINAVLWDQPDAIQAEMQRVIPAMKANGGYIFLSDHSVPSSVSLDDFRRIIELAKKLGKY
jgi:uroporphyrinogen decarboxylase